MTGKNPKVDAYLSEPRKWPKELKLLRKLLLESGLTEEFKWKGPCYTFGKTNLIMLGELKESCVLGFYKGVLLSDAHGILQSPGENSQSMRWIKFTGPKQIKALEPTLKAYVYEAIEAERAGLKVSFVKSTELEYPEELQRKLDGDVRFKSAFNALTPGRRRAYNLYFTAAKQPKTRESRIEKCVEQILEGRGLNDR